MENKAYKNKDWMTKNWESLKNKSFKEIHIVGSHDSTCNKMNYDISTNVFKGLPLLYRFLGALFPCIVDKFTKTQKLSIYEQLCIGVRYFDFRICLYDNIYYCSHTYMCGLLDDYLEQIRKFNLENPDELIIIQYGSDYNHRNTVSNLDVLHNYIYSYLNQNNNNKNIVNVLTKTLNNEDNKTFLMTQKLETVKNLGPIILFNTFESVWFNVNSVPVFFEKYEEYCANYSTKTCALGCTVTPNEKTNFLEGSIEKYANEIKKKLITEKQIDKSLNLFCVYNFDYVDEEIVDYFLE